MIKFKEHDGMLFKMLEEPVPLTPDAEMPCLIRLIQDDSPMGRTNKLMSSTAKCLDMIYTAINVKSYSVESSVRELPFHCHAAYEIIGTFVEEGSDDWAWHMMQEGYKIKHCESTSQRFYAIREGNNYCAFYDNEWKEVDINTRRIYCEFIEYAKAFPGYGWGIYKEPEPEPQYKIGDWVKCKDLAGVPAQCKVLEIHEHNVVVECTTGHRWSLPHNNIVRKISPSEIIVNIGCLSGTVRINGEDCEHFLLKHSPGRASTIRFDALDTETRELVESLLEAQEEE